MDGLIYCQMPDCMALNLMMEIQPCYADGLVRVMVGDMVAGESILMAPAPAA